MMNDRKNEALPKTLNVPRLASKKRFSFLEKRISV